MTENESNSPLAGLHILAVDDEPDILATIEDVLDESVVDTAQDFETAQAKLANYQYDLAILDIMGVNGLALLSEAVNRKIPTVMLTANAVNVETLKESITKGALSYLPKEELANLDTFLVDLLAAAKAGNSTWNLLFDKLGGFFERAFGADWAAEDPNFWRIYYPYF